MKRILLIALSLVTLFSAYVNAADQIDSSRTMLEAIKLADLGKTEQALAKLDPLESSISWYNKATLLARLNRLGESRYYFEKALRQNPRDSDTQANLDWVKAQLLQKSVVIDPPKNVWNPLSLISKTISMSELNAFVSVTWLLMWGIFICRFYSKKNDSNQFLYFIIFFFLIGLSTLVFKIAHEGEGRYGIIIAKEVPLYGTFIDTNNSLETLPEGAKVEIISTQWIDEVHLRIQVSTPNGGRGWVDEEKLNIL